MSESENKFKEALDKVSVNNKQTGEESTEDKSSDIKTKSVWNKITIPVTCLSIVILIAALIGIMLTAGRNRDAICGNSEAISGGGYQESEETSDTESEQTSENISEDVSEPEEVFVSAEGDTFAKAHPDKTDITGYSIVWYGDNDKTEIRPLSGGCAKITFDIMICGGSIKAAASDSVIQESVVSRRFMVYADGDDGEVLMRLKIYENGYIKFYTGTGDESLLYYELYYNPKGYDIDEIFDDFTYYYDDALPFSVYHPELYPVSGNSTVTYIYTGSTDKVLKTVIYAGKTAQGILNAILCDYSNYIKRMGDNDYIDREKSLSEYSYKIVIPDTSIELCYYSRGLLVYCKDGVWEYYHICQNTYIYKYIEYVSSRINDTLKYSFDEENGDFNIDGVKINYVNYSSDGITGYAVAETDHGAGQGIYSVWKTSDSGKTWILVTHNLKVGGYILAIKATGAYNDVMAFLDNRNATSETAETWYLGADGSVVNKKKLQQLAVNFIYKIYIKDTDGIAGLLTGDIKDDYLNVLSDFGDGTLGKAADLFSLIDSIDINLKSNMYGGTTSICYANTVWTVNYTLAQRDHEKYRASFEVTCENGEYLVKGFSYSIIHIQ